MATGIGAHHEALFVPEHVQQATFAPLMQEPSVAKTIGLMKKAECLLYSVGSAIIMGERRGLTEEQMATLKRRKQLEKRSVVSSMRRKCGIKKSHE